MYGKNLFKYLGAAGLKVLENNTVKFSSRSELNDPFETLYSSEHLNDPNEFNAIIWETAQRGFGEFCKRSREKGKRVPTMPEYIEMIRESAKTKNLSMAFMESQLRRHELFRIFCLTAVAPDQNDSLLLWSHYTDGHRGLVLEFDRAHEWLNPLHPDAGVGERLCGEVAYSGTRPVLGSKPDDAFVFTKSECWRYEGEYRLIKHEAVHPELRDDPARRFWDFPAAALSSVTIGCKMANEHREKVKNLIIEKYPATKLFQAGLHVDKFGMISEQIIPTALPNPPESGPYVFDKR
jgi:hypothetical protein